MEERDIWKKGGKGLKKGVGRYTRRGLNREWGMASRVCLRANIVGAHTMELWLVSEVHARRTGLMTSRHSRAFRNRFVFDENALIRNGKLATNGLHRGFRGFDG